MGKICNKCLEEFNTRGFKCQPCYQKEYYETNKNKIKEKKIKYYQANKDKIDLKSSQYVKQNKQKVKDKNKKHYLNNKEIILKYQKQIRNTPKRKYSQGIKSAKDRNLLWDISFIDYSLIIAQTCHYCDCSLEKYGGSSLDRIDNSLGYTVANVLPCCGTCNNIRNNFLSVKEMEVAMAAVVKLRKGELNES